MPSILKKNTVYHQIVMLDHVMENFSFPQKQSGFKINFKEKKSVFSWFTTKENLLTASDVMKQDEDDAGITFDSQ